MHDQNEVVSRVRTQTVMGAYVGWNLKWDITNKRQVNKALSYFVAPGHVTGKINRKHSKGFLGLHSRDKLVRCNKNSECGTTQISKYCAAVFLVSHTYIDSRKFKCRNQRDFRNSEHNRPNKKQGVNERIHNVIVLATSLKTQFQQSSPTSFRPQFA